MEVDTTQTVSEIARRYPAAVAVFEALGIDYCCGGNKSLEDACQKKNVSLNLVLSDLRARLSPGHASRRPLDDVAVSRITAHIVTQHHGYAKRELPRLTALAAKVQSRHGQAHQELDKIFASLWKP